MGLGDVHQPQILSLGLESISSQLKNRRIYHKYFLRLNYSLEQLFLLYKVILELIMWEKPVPL